ncbi:extracellular solute-binding protein [Paenibacillus sp. FSL M7-0420]|uniref:extracellular solute-binding protein n=1 Tax=Paenibacillus sp. FSL M7-0420 TaxID=2921609 RepID=UPI0030FB4422
MRKIAALSISTVLLALTACSSPSNTNTKDTASSSADPKQPIDLRVGRYSLPTWGYPAGDDFANNIWYRHYADKFNLNVIHEWTALQNEYNEKLNIVIASGSIPDIVIEASTNQLETMVKAGMTADLTDVFEEHASDLTKEILTGDGGLAMDSATFDGKLMALPYTTSVIYEPSLLWVRQDWLDKLNLPVPKTIDDVIAVAKAFKEQDPDGNGIDDTGGLAFSNWLFDGITSTTGFFNGYHAYPQSWLKGDDGKITYGSVQPEMKNALAKLREMYQAGLIDPEFGMKDTTKVTEEVSGGKYGISYGRCWNVYMYGTGLEGQPDMVWTPVAAPSADGQDVFANVGTTVVSYYAVNKDYKHPEILVQLLNDYNEMAYGPNRNDPEVKKFFAFEKGQTIVEQGHLSLARTLTTDDATVKSLEYLIEAIEKRDPSKLDQALTETGKYEPSVAYLDGKGTGYMEYHQVKAFKTIVEGYGTDRLIPQAYGGTTETMLNKMGILGDYEREIFTKIIMGAEPIDAFDTFVSEWHKLGGQQILDEINASL